MPVETHLPAWTGGPSRGAEEGNVVLARAMEPTMTPYAQQSAVRFLDTALMPPGVLRHGDIDLHVRVADLGARAPSQEQRERKAVVLDRAALLGA